jgi:hypothetical protein
MKIYTKKVLFLITLTTCLFGFANYSFASLISLEPENLSLNLNDTYNIKVTLSQITKPLNVIEGEILIPQGFTASSVDVSHSAVKLWTVKPKYVISDGKIIFTGGNPENFKSGSNNILFSFKVKAKNEGNFSLVVSNAKAYLADGFATLELPKTNVSKINISSDNKSRATIPTVGEGYNNSKPVEFVYEIGNDPSLFDGKKFLTFYGGGNESGVYAYYVKEGLISSWQEVDTYYVLKDQNLKSKLLVKILSNDGEDQKIIVKSDSTILVLSVILILAVFIFIKRKK